MLEKFPLYCPKCKRETLVNIKEFNTEPVDFPRFFRPVLGGVIWLYLFAQFGTLIVNICIVDHTGYTSSKYYHINRTTGSYIIFADLFDEKHYTALEELIMTQMKNQMAQSEDITYWIEDSEIGEDFITLNANQNFYFKENGNLVLVYNKYEVGPGSMGCPEFELLPEEYMEYMNPSIAELFGQE